jgi:hypothetical protein
MQFDRLKRRDFITLLGGAAARPIAAHAQPTRVARIGYVSGTGSAADRGPFVEALQQGMREHGYVDGKDFIVEYRGAEGRPPRPIAVCYPIGRQAREALGGETP